jgi:hypothetical protein
MVIVFIMVIMFIMVIIQDPDLILHHGFLIFLNKLQMYLIFISFLIIIP